MMVDNIELIEKAYMCVGYIGYEHVPIEGKERIKCLSTILGFIFLFILFFSFQAGDGANQKVNSPILHKLMNRMYRLQGSTDPGQFGFFQDCVPEAAGWEIHEDKISRKWLLVIVKK
jgi:hypothetical protein